MQILWIFMLIGGLFLIILPIMFWPLGELSGKAAIILTLIGIVLFVTGFVKFGNGVVMTPSAQIISIEKGRIRDGNDYNKR